MAANIHDHLLLPNVKVLTHRLLKKLKHVVRCTGEKENKSNAR